MKVYCLCFENSGGLWKNKTRPLERWNDVAQRGITMWSYIWGLVACLQEILKFSALRLNFVAILAYHLTGCPTLPASNKLYHFSKNLIKVYFVNLHIPSIRALFFPYISHTELDFVETWATLYVMHTIQVQQFSDLFCYVTWFYNS